MRSVAGFERPAVQWLFVALAVALVAIGAALTIALWRTRTEIAGLQAANLQARADQQALEVRAARERAARESLALELARQRGRAAAAAAPPTLTLQPLRARGPVPAAATVEAPDAALLIELRLLLPSAGNVAAGPYTVTLRDWSGGQVVWSRGRLPMGKVEENPAVVTIVTGDVLRPGAYEIVLTAPALSGAPVDVATYEVTVR